MKTTIIAIGNSKGVRIPKPLLEESGLVKDVEIKLIKDGLKITPIKSRTPRISETLLMSQEALAREWDTPEEDAAWADIVVGEVVAVPFPFSDLSGKKLRPAVVVAAVDSYDLIFCQITSKDRSKHGAIKLSYNNFQEGNLPLVSYARPDKLFTGEASIIVKSRGKLTNQTKSSLLESIRQIFTEESK